MTILQEQHYPAPVERVWQALTDREAMRDWYFDIPAFTPVEGAVFEFYEPGGQRRFLHRCTITKVEPMRLLQHTWTYPNQSQGSSLVSWELQPEGEGTRVKLTHEGIESLSDGGPEFLPENYEAGWKDILGVSLRQYLDMD